MNEKSLNPKSKLINQTLQLEHCDIICFLVCLLFPSLFFSSSKLLNIAQQKQYLRLLEVSQKTENGAEKWFCVFIYLASLMTYLKISCFQNVTYWLALWN